MFDTLHASSLFLVNTIFDLYLFVLMIRLVLVWVGFNYFDPITQLVVKLTDFIIKPLRRFLPNVSGIETATLAIILTLQLIKFYLISMLSFGMPNIVGLIVLSLGDSVKLLIQVFFYAILLEAILSWVQPGSAPSYFLHRFTSPIMQPIRRLIPAIGGFDISPIPALILLQLLIISVAAPLTSFGLSLAVG